MSNIFAIYKPKGPTSNRIISKIKKITDTKKVGHAGTLDPLAEGVLVVAIGREATKQLSTVVVKEKEYIAEITLGITSSTDDAEGKLVENIKLAPPNGLGLKVIKLKDIEKILPKFIGEIMQVPPIYSATKVSGQAAYKLARQGKYVKLGAGQVEIKEIEILNYEWPKLKLRVVTGSGVYIRSLARDIGKELGVGGYLSSLIRTRVGEFKIENAIDIDKNSADLLKKLNIC